MLKWLGSLVDSNEKQLKRLHPLVERINPLEPQFEKLSAEELKAKTAKFKARLAQGETLDALLPEAFAAVREAAKRTIGQRHFDVQLMGGIVLHQGRISEMKTGEGKTLVATLSLYLNSLTSQGCHLVTVNDYLSKRDAHWMGPIYHALGVSVASIQHEASWLYDHSFVSEDARWSFLRPVSRRQAYEADITYGTNNEFGFDYLRDNMVLDLSQCVQRPLNYAIVDEVDNILVDEARTPLIISGPAEDVSSRYYLFARLIPTLRCDEDYTVNEKERAVSLTDEGTSKVEGTLKREGLLKSPSIYDPANYSLTYYLDNALKAHVLFKRDRDYVVKDGQVIIVDEFTGRLMFGRRYSEGLHQAIEAKEGVKIQRESLTLATITFQNYFRIYKKLAGMTGTAVTEAEEFYKIYKLEVMSVPTHKPMIRIDYQDQIYKNEEAKFKAVVKEIEGLHQEKRPVLVGTVSIEKSEYLSEMLKRRGVPHQVLNAKQHEREAAIIAQAGQPGMVTVATNMAGRGVDIMLGGNPQAMALDILRHQSLDPATVTPEQQKTALDEASGHCAENRKLVVKEEWDNKQKKDVLVGGLHIIGTERHEARRIDNQLRGRSGRQGDPGSSRFYVSLEDDIVRRFGGDRIGGVMRWAGLGEEVPLESGLVGKFIENCQVKVEGYHFEVRKHLVDYDDVANKHREVIYDERRKILSGFDLKANIQSLIHGEVEALVAAHLSDDYGRDWNTEELRRELETILPGIKLDGEEFSRLSRKDITDRLLESIDRSYEEKEHQVGAENMRILERLVMLRSIDRLWVEHLTMMEHMRQGIGLHAVGQRDPLVMYKHESHRMFQSLKDNIQHEVVHTIFKVDIVKERPAPPPRPVATSHPAAPHSTEPKSAVPAGHKVGRNDPCPCGSGKKYKRCCGQ